MTAGQVRLQGVGPGVHFWRSIAQEMLRDGEPVLSSALLIVPSFKVLPDFAQALGQAAQGTLWLPEITTLVGVLSQHGSGQPGLSNAQRQLGLYDALRNRDWFGEANLWAVSDELITLFDELTLCGGHFPEDPERFRQLLAQQYSVPTDTASLRFEAQMTHRLWQAESHGQPSEARLQCQAAQTWVAQANCPLWVVAEGPLSRFENNLYDAYAQRQPVTVWWPDRAQTYECYGLLNAAWPVGERLAQGVEALKARVDAIPSPEDWSEHISLIPAEDMESLAEHVALTVMDWRQQGLEKIALVAVDRLPARRIRALLARVGIEVDDETGWKFVTTRVAAFIDSFLRVLIEDGYHADLMDFIRSPYAFADESPDLRPQCVAQIETFLQTRHILSGLAALETSLQSASVPLALGLGWVQRLRTLQETLGRGARQIPTDRRTVSGWLAWLQTSLTAIGAQTALKADAAGEQWLEWLERTAVSLAQTSVTLSLSEWRSWLDDQMERALFVPPRVPSAIVLTPLSATRLRLFDAVILIGADEKNLTPTQTSAVFAHDGVRKELGLPTRAEHQARLREDLAWLVCSCPNIVLAWQKWREGEAQLLSPDWAILESAQRLAHRAGFREAIPWADLPTVSHRPQTIPAPSIPATRRPTSLSASGYGALLACPYLYFARYVLGLNALEPLEEGLTKRDYGQAIHGVLQNFHQRYPVLKETPRNVLIETLWNITQTYFDEAIRQNYFEVAWLLRWQNRLPDYIDWQLEREAQGWFFSQAEQTRTRPLVWPTGEILLKGRLDRVDRKTSAPECAVLDYKLRKVADLKAQVEQSDDPQLAFYTLLSELPVAEAAYVALDDEKGVQSIPCKLPQERAQEHESHIRTLFEAIDQGVGLPANGVQACRRCEMRGLCRKDYLVED